MINQYETVIDLDLKPRTIENYNFNYGLKLENWDISRIETSRRKNLILAASRA